MAELKVVRSLTELKVLVVGSLEKVRVTQETFQQRRLEAGRLLLELRTRVEAGEAGEIKWWEYYEKNFTFHRRTAELCMQWASAPDPEQAKADYDAANRERQRAFVERGGSVASHANYNSQPEPDGEPASRSKPRPVPTRQLDLEETVIQQELIDQALALVDQMNIPTKARFARLLEVKF